MAAPSSSGNHTLAARVGGHAGVLASDDESLIIKPALALELAFYQHVATAPEFAPLRNWIPAFMGTLKLHGKQEGTSREGAPIIAPLAPEAEGVEKDHVVLENLTHGFVRPNVLDVKLGTVLYDQDASPEKRQRMEKGARETTSLETGIRLTGFQVYDNTTGEPVHTDKFYGKSLKPEQLSEGIARIFPRFERDGNGLSASTLSALLTRLLADLREIRSALAGVELRMVGGSVLIVYEGLEERAVEGLKRMEEQDAKGDEDEDEDDEDSEEEDEKKAVAYKVKLIDFAHTRLVPGQGPDEGVLLGLDTLSRLVEERIAAINFT